MGGFNSANVLNIVANLLALFPTMIPAIQSVVTGIKEAFDKNQLVTPQDIHNIVNRAVLNHGVAESLLKPD